MILYLDTSALVKLYAAEPGSSVVRRAVAESDLIATSLMSYLEARSALARKGRSGELLSAVLGRRRREFERDWARHHRLPVDETIVRKAGDLVEEHALRAVDALHLAAADSFQALLRAAVTFACFDSALNGAAKVHGLELLVRNQAEFARSDNGDSVRGKPLRDGLAAKDPQLMVGVSPCVNVNT